MAAAHSFDEPSPSTSLSAQPSDFEMPDVILHPPEDDVEHDGPRLVFDAAAAHNAAANSATTIESRLGMWQKGIANAAPIFFASQAPATPSTSPRRASVHRSRPAARWDYTAEDPFTFEGHKRRGEEMDTDSVQVEVMKVPRGRMMADITEGRSPPPKKSSLRARASIALRNIRGKNNGSRKGAPPTAAAAPVKENAAPVAAVEPPVQKIAASTSEAGHSLHRSKSAKRLSSPISQFFARNNAPPVPPVPSLTLQEPAVNPPSEPSTSANSSIVQDSTVSSSVLHSSLGLGEPQSLSSSTKASRRRKSFNKLQSIFAQPTPSLNPVAPPMPPSRPASPAYTNDSAPSPEMSDDTPATPLTPVFEEDFTIASIPSFIVGNGEPQPPKPLYDEDEEMGDVSFEMRLDSLHFENLSFDVDRFA